MLKSKSNGKTAGLPDKDSNPDGANPDDPKRSNVFSVELLPCLVTACRAGNRI